MSFVLLAIAIVFNVSGQLLLKRAAMAGGSDDGHAIRAFLNAWFFVGCASLGLSMILWVIVLRKVPVSIAHPITGTAFVLVPVFAHFVWGEPLTSVRLAGIAAIVVGVYLVARGGA